MLNKYTKILFVFLLFLVLFLVGVYSVYTYTLLSSRQLPVAYLNYTYGDSSRTFNIADGGMAVWESLVDVNLTSITTTDQESSGTTLYVTDTTVFEDCELDGTTTVMCDGQLLTITGVTTGEYLTVSSISGTIASSTAISSGVVLTCYDDSAPYDDSIQINGGITSSDYFLVIRAAEGHEGTPTSGVRFEKTSTSNVYIFDLRRSYSWVCDIAGKVTITTTSGSSTPFFYTTATDGGYTGCIAYDCSSGSGSVHGFFGTNLSGTMSLINCVAIGIGDHNVDSGLRTNITVAGYDVYNIYNCTFVDSKYGMYVASSGGQTTTINLKNTILQDNSVNNIYTTGVGTKTVNQTTNALSDGVVFCTDGYHLHPDDTAAAGGTDLSSVFDDDIDGLPRLYWDMGADEFRPNDLLDLKITIKDDSSDLLDLKIRVYDPVTWYIRPSTYSVGDNDGTSYINAWQGWDEIDWNDITYGDIVKDYSGEKYRLDDIEYYPGAKVQIQGQVEINGETVVDNSTWTQVGATNVWRIPVTAQDIDYFQQTAPVSPSDGEIWFKSALESSTSFGYQYGMAFEYSSAKGKWGECRYYYKPNMVFVNDVFTQPGITSSGSVDTIGATSFTDSAYAGVADDYWIGYTIYCNINPWCYTGYIITDSVGSTGEVVVGTISSTPSLTPESFIIGNPNELSVQYEWGYYDDYLYMYFDSDPTSSEAEISYTEGGAAIILNDCQGIEISGYNISKINDAAVLVKDSYDIDIKDNVISDVYCNDLKWWRGAINFSGRDVTTTSYSMTNNSSDVSATNNRINDVHNGHALTFFNYNDSSATYNQCVNIKNSLYMGSPCGVFTLFCNGLTVTDNFWNYCSYSGFWATYVDTSLIDNNVCYHTMDTYSDGSAIYIAAADDNEVSNNRIEFTGDFTQVRCVYVDFNSDDNSVHDNTVYGHHGLGSGNTYDTGYINAAFWEHDSAGTTNNSCIDNSIYDDYCTLVDANSNTGSWTGTTSGNTRYSESSYEFMYTYFLDLKLLIEIGESLGIGGIDATGIGGIENPTGFGGL